MKIARLITAALILASSCAFAQTRPGVKDSLFSEVLKEQRHIRVIVPTEYKPGGAEKYETVYMPDGEWYMEQIPFIYNFTVGANFAPKAVIVLIPNTYVNGVNLRDRDYSPTATDGDTNLGHADSYHAFLKTELIPYVEKKYPVNGDRIIVGSSFSGLFSVWAFLKDPTLFKGYLASDPNLNWDNFYASKLAEKVLKAPGLDQSLYIAGNESSFHDMGIARMDSVLKVAAPAGLHWNVQIYENETHYSVQHKAFYDGFRFMHFGYTTDEPAFHPMHGIIEPGKSIHGFFIASNPAWHYTIDGAEPTLASPVVKGGGAGMIGSSPLKLKTFGHRAAYKRELTQALTVGKALEPPKTKKHLTPGLTFSHYTGDWTILPDSRTLKPAVTKPFDANLNMNEFTGKQNSLYVIAGVLEVPEDAYYVVAANSDATRISIDNQLLYDQAEAKRTLQSVGAPLKKGLHPFRVEMLRKNGNPEVEYIMFRTTSSTQEWWRNAVR